MLLNEVAKGKRVTSLRRGDQMMISDQNNDE